METIHLEHALLDVADLDRSLSFYRDLLPDWVIRWEGRGQDGGRWVHFGPPGGGQPGYLSLYEAGRQGEDRGGGARIRHIGFAHPDVAALVEAVAARGRRPSDRVEDEAYRRAYFTDPDGHELEFVQILT
ncbi:MAG TPA: VOC family protein [Candidatus Polarisedimenticolia bacterium]|nr:VOC family protein [Candidatus Polarisedimenticolia bacterium]